MQSSSTSVILLLLCCLCSPGEALSNTCESDTAEFVLVKENKGITLYERWYAVSPDLQAREVKATLVINASAEDAVALIRDEALGKKWNRNTESYKVLTEDSDNWFGYIQYDLPWPVSNQDCVLKYNRFVTEDATEVFFENAKHPAFPPQKRIQRIPEISGKWIFTETETGMAVEYYITTMPSATLPTWITDPIIRNNLIETLHHFKNILEKNT